MSLILDAIKKSERERQQQQVPGLASNHEEYQSTDSPSNKWPLFLGLLILIAVAVYFMAPNKWFTSEQQIEIAPTETKKIESVFPQQKEEPPLELKPSNEEKKTFTPPVITPPKPIKQPSVNGNVINLNPEIIKALPEINFSSHVFTGNSATSFVVLNDELLGVGEMFNDEIEIIQINQDGMIVLIEGQKVFIKALENINL